MDWTISCQSYTRHPKISPQQHQGTTGPRAVLLKDNVSLPVSSLYRNKLTVILHETVAQLCADSQSELTINDSETGAV